MTKRVDFLERFALTPCIIAAGILEMKDRREFFESVRLGFLADRSSHGVLS